jgi:hypothetical protein
MSHALSNRLHHARALSSRRERERRLHLILPLYLQQIIEIETRRAVPDQYLAWTRFLLPDFLQPHRLGLAPRLYLPRFHEFLVPICYSERWMKLLLALSLILSMVPLLAQRKEMDRPPLFFREDFKETEAEKPVTPAHLANPNLVLSLHGPGRQGIKKSHHDKPADDPFYIWSGEAMGNWAVSLRHKDQFVDLRDLAKIRWRSKQAGFRQLRIIIQLADRTWLASDQSDSASEDWREREFNIADIRWRKLDIKTITEGAWAPGPDLSRVREIGFTDLMQGGGSIACSRLDWIEVYARPAK